MKRKPMVITQEDKERYLKKHSKLAKKAFDGSVVHKKKFVNGIRKEFNYSPNTIDFDIWSSFFRAWRKMKGER